MADITSAVKNTVPISRFNKGFAGKIFDEVKRTGPKVVMKNNTPECVLLPPDEYIRLMNEVNVARLISVALERLNIPADKLIEDGQEELNCKKSE